MWFVCLFQIQNGNQIYSDDMDTFRLAVIFPISPSQYQCILNSYTFYWNVIMANVKYVMKLTALLMWTLVLLKKKNKREKRIILTDNVIDARYNLKFIYYRNRYIENMHIKLLFDYRMTNVNK